MAKDPLDVQIGGRLKEARLVRNMTLQALGKHLGISYQQVRKYELGDNRISASMLYHLTQVLNVDPGVFFAPKRVDDGDATPAGIAPDIENRRLADAIRRVEDPEVREHLLGLIRALDRWNASEPNGR